MSGAGAANFALELTRGPFLGSRKGNCTAARRLQFASSGGAVGRGSRRAEGEAGAGGPRAAQRRTLGGHDKLISLVALVPEDCCPWHERTFTSPVQVGCRRRFVLTRGNTEAVAGAAARSRVTHVEE